VKSTLIIKENLQEMNARGVANQYPVILGGAALTRAYVEEDLAEIFEGEVRYARDAFEGLRLMDTIMQVWIEEPIYILSWVIILELVNCMQPLVWHK
jgi:5-methyltetrahydrofolate--homocysteine methyltransferase